jgi:hypothetical protein
MARLARVALMGVPQHIIQRGNNRQACFAGEEDMKAYPTHSPVSHFARIPCSASTVHRHHSPVPRNTGRYPANRTDSPSQYATDNWTRDTPPDRRSGGHEPDLTPHIGHTPTNRRLSLSDWTDSGLPKASPFGILADSQTGSGAPTTASSMAPIR